MALRNTSAENFFSQFENLKNHYRHLDDLNGIELCQQTETLIKDDRFAPGTKRWKNDLLPIFHLSSTKISEITGLTVNNVRVRRSRLGKEIDQALGHDFCRVAKDGLQGLKTARRRLILADKLLQKNQLLIDEVVLNVGHPVRMFPVRECVEELRFLLDYTAPVVTARLRKMDQEKLGFLVGVINGVIAEDKENIRVNFLETVLKKVAEVEGE